MELIKAYKVGFKYFLDEAKANRYADELARQYSKNRLDAFTPKVIPMAKLDNGSRVVYMLLKPLEEAHVIVE